MKTEEIMLGGIIDGGQKEIPFQQAIVSCTPGLVAGIEIFCLLHF